MARPESNVAVPQGGRGSTGGCYHLSFRSGSRGGGACASAAHAYITRSGEYDDEERDPAIYAESDHMPAWAQDDAREYWDAADLYERANGRLYVSADFALPRDLSTEDQVAMARSFAQELTADERLPYTLAVHVGRDADSHEHNPHAHLMISERQNDGVPREQEQWFRRANRAHPHRGGAPKSRTFHGREWMEQARERWAELTNTTLSRNGRAERVDQRSYARQGVDREPGRHYGPAAALMVSRGVLHERLEREVERADVLARVALLERELQTATTDAARGGGRVGMGQDTPDGAGGRRPHRQNDPGRTPHSGPER